MTTRTATAFRNVSKTPKGSAFVGDHFMHSSTRPNQEGFSIIEMMIAVGIMVIVTAAVCSLMRDSIRVSKTTYELTDAQENLRTAQEYVNRDLMNAGDGLK